MKVALLILILVAVNLFLWRLVSLIERAGADEERARRAEEDAEIARAQGEVMAEARSDEDTIDRLDRGTF